MYPVVSSSPQPDRRTPCRPATPDVSEDTAEGIDMQSADNNRQLSESAFAMMDGSHEGVAKVVTDVKAKIASIKTRLHIRSCSAPGTSGWTASAAPWRCWSWPPEQSTPVLAKGDSLIFSSVSVPQATPGDSRRRTGQEYGSGREVPSSAPATRHAGHQSGNCPGSPRFSRASPR